MLDNRTMTCGSLCESDMDKGTASRRFSRKGNIFTTFMFLGAMLLSSLTFAPLAAASTIDALTCLSQSDPLHANDEKVVWSHGSFILKCGQGGVSGFGLKHIDESHPYGPDLTACMADVLDYGSPSSADSPNMKYVFPETDGMSATVVYLPGSVPYKNSIVTAFTSGSSSQWTRCASLYGG